MTHNRNVSDPNPIHAHGKNRTANQINADGGPKGVEEKQMMDLLKFGRRVVFDRQLSNKDVLEIHLNTVKEHA